MKVMRGTNGWRLSVSSPLDEVRLECDPEAP